MTVRGDPSFLRFHRRMEAVFYRRCCRNRPFDNVPVLKDDYGSRRYCADGLMAVLLVGVAALLTRVENWRSYTPLAGGGAVTGDEAAVINREKPAGIIRWLTTVDHKDIGLLYGVYAVIAFAVGGIMAMLIRLQLVTPAGAILGNNAYNSILTSHGITMLFLFGTPIIAAFANYFIPLLIGADDMAFPRINAIAFWLLPPAPCLSGPDSSSRR